MLKFEDIPGESLNERSFSEYPDFKSDRISSSGFVFRALRIERIILALNLAAGVFGSAF